MKKKHRDIVVDDVTYGYIVIGHGKERGITIYRDRKRILYTEYRVATVTPKMIEELIREKILNLNNGRTKNI